MKPSFYYAIVMAIGILSGFVIRDYQLRSVCGKCQWRSGVDHKACLGYIVCSACATQIKTHHICRDGSGNEYIREHIKVETKP